MKEQIGNLFKSLMRENKEFKENLQNDLTEVLLTIILNKMLEAERDIYLDDEDTSDMRNGYTRRKIFFGNIPVELRKPRTRKKEFQSVILPKYQRAFPTSYENLIRSALLTAKSLNSLKMTLSELGVPYSESEIEKIVKTIKEEFISLNSRELSSDWLFIYIDAKELEVKKGGEEEGKEESRKVRKANLLTAIGIDLKGKKEFLCSYLHYGNENLEAWKGILETLSTRGVRRVLMFLTDDFPGLGKVIKSFFPQSLHQLYLIHLLRNSKYRLSKEVYKRFVGIMKKIEGSESYEEARELFDELIKTVSGKHPHFGKKLKRDEEKYIAFTKFPKEIRSRIKSTNASENLHKELENIRRNSGGYFQSEDMLWIKWGIFIGNLQNRRWHKPEPIIQSKLFELRQMFKKNFEIDSEVI